MKRWLPRIVGLFAAIGPPLWAHFAIEADRAAQIAAERTFLCGNAAMVLIFLACIASGVASLLSASLFVWLSGWQTLVSSWPRIIEAALLLLPFFGALAVAPPFFS